MVGIIYLAAIFSFIFGAHYFFKYDENHEKHSYVWALLSLAGALFLLAWGMDKYPTSMLSYKDDGPKDVTNLWIVISGLSLVCAFASYNVVISWLKKK